MELKERLSVEQKVIAIELPVSVWNIVMNALGQRPYLEVAEIINRMKEQADASLRSVDEETTVDG